MKGESGKEGQRSRAHRSVLPFSPFTLTFTLLVACGSARADDAQARTFGLWPFLTVQRSAERTEVEALGPLIHYRRAPEGTSWGLRPLFAVHADAAQGWRTWQVLYPFSYFRTGPAAGRQFVFPLYYRSWRTAANGQPDRAGVVFPLLWWGHHPTGGPWFVVPLVGGVCRGLLGQDEILHASWLYNRASWRGYVQHHVLWPFISWASNGQGRRSLRLWPLYGRSEDRGKWWNGFVLWPFVTYGRREAGQQKPAADYWMLWPLFGRARSRDGAGGSIQVLWPFFRYQWHTPSGFRGWHLPWPIVVGSKRSGVQTTNVWPLWGARRWKGGVNRFYLWPFVHTSRVRTQKSETDDVKVFPFFTSTTVRRRDPASTRAFRLLWPLWRWRSRQQGDQWHAQGNSLQLAWFDNPEGLDRGFNALLGLYEHEASSDGRRATRLLWRMLRFERGPEFRRTQLGPVASWSRSGRLTKMSVLLGLLQTGQRDGRRGWRILFVPFGASLAEAPPPPAEESPRGE